MNISLPKMLRHPYKAVLPALGQHSCRSRLGGGGHEAPRVGADGEDVPLLGAIPARPVMVAQPAVLQDEEWGRSSERRRGAGGVSHTRNVFIKDVAGEG